MSGKANRTREDVPDAVKLEVAILLPHSDAPGSREESAVAGGRAHILVLGAAARSAFVARCLAPEYEIDARPDIDRSTPTQKARVPDAIICLPHLFDPDDSHAGPGDPHSPAVLLIPEQEELEELVHRRALPAHVHILVWPFTEQVLRTRIRSLLSENTLPG